MPSQFRLAEEAENSILGFSLSLVTCLADLFWIKKLFLQSTRWRHSLAEMPSPS
jgi:hypothetical protein